MILVTGATGFIGSYVVRALEEKLLDVLAVDLNRNSKLDKNNSENNTQYITGFDIRDEESVGKLFRDFKINTVIHLASVLNQSSNLNPAHATDVNVLGSLNILEAACYAKAKRLIYGSSISVYGGAKKETATREIDPALPIEIYGASKRYVEALGQALSSQYDIDFVTLRIPIVVGEGALSTTSPWRSDIFESLLSRTKKKVILPFRKKIPLPMIHAEDLAETFSQMVIAPSLKHRVYNSPCESVISEELGNFIQELNDQIDVNYGRKSIAEFPSVMNSNRIKNELRLSPHSIQNRMREYFYKGR